MSTTRIGDALLLAVAVVWGSSYLTAKSLTVAGGVLVLLALRFLISAATMLPVLAFQSLKGQATAQTTPRAAEEEPAGRAAAKEAAGRAGDGATGRAAEGAAGRETGQAAQRVSRRELGTGVLLGVTQATVLLLETYGVSLTSATNAGVLISLTILMTPILEGLVSRRWLPRSFFLAAAAATAGVILLVAGPGLRPPSTGDALMLAAAVVRAVHVTLSAHLTRNRSYRTGVLTALQTVTGAALFTPALFAVPWSYSPAQWLAVTYLALGCSVFAFVVQLWAIRRTSASRASLLLGTEPVWAVFFGLLLAGDRLSPIAVAGIVLVLAGTYLGQRVENRARSMPSLPDAMGGVAAGRQRQPVRGGAEGLAG